MPHGTRGRKVRFLAHEEALLAAGELSNKTHAGASAAWLEADSTILPCTCGGSGSAHAEFGTDAGGERAQDGVAISQPTSPAVGADAGAAAASAEPCITATTAASLTLAACPLHSETLLYRPMGDAEIRHLVQHQQLPATQPYQAVIEGEAGRAYSARYLTGSKKVDTAPSTVVELRVPRALQQQLFALQHKAEDGVLSMGLGPKAGGGLPLVNAALASGEASWRIVLVKRRPRG